MSTRRMISTSIWLVRLSVPITIIIYLIFFHTLGNTYRGLKKKIITIIIIIINMFVPVAVETAGMCNHLAAELIQELG